MSVENCDVQPFLLLPTVHYLRLLFGKLFMGGPYLLVPYLSYRYSSYIDRNFWCEWNN